MGADRREPVRRRTALPEVTQPVDQAGRGMETEYVSFDRPTRVAIRMTRGPWIFRKFSGAWIYEELDPARTRVVFKYHVESRIPLGRLTDAILARIFAGEMETRLTALRDAVERDGVLAVTSSRSGS